ncbi:hypothetical protein BMF94_5827, partial [Rhodotorula taiwanensis]
KKTARKPAPKKQKVEHSEEDSE